MIGSRPVRARRLAAALLAGALLLVALASSAEAQRQGGGGRGRHRGGPERDKTAQEALGPGEYALGGEDGRLEVREVFGLDLHARLVVLSACETGLGQLSRGDELVGLQRAFLYAGTPAVVTTLWKVDDRASFELIRAFYDRLDADGPVAALRRAQLETQRAFPHPFAWAAFGLTGVSR